MYKQVIWYRFHEESSETLHILFFYSRVWKSCPFFTIYEPQMSIKKKEKKKGKKKHLAGMFSTELTGKLTISFTIAFAGAVALLTKNLFWILFDWSLL